MEVGRAIQMKQMKQGSNPKCLAIQDVDQQKIAVRVMVGIHADDNKQENLQLFTSCAQNLGQACSFRHPLQLLRSGSDHGNMKVEDVGLTILQVPTMSSPDHRA